MKKEKPYKVKASKPDIDKSANDLKLSRAHVNSINKLFSDILIEQLKNNNKFFTLSATRGARNLDFRTINRIIKNNIESKHMIFSHSAGLDIRAVKKRAKKKAKTSRKKSSKKKSIKNRQYIKKSNKQVRVDFKR